MLTNNWRNALLGNILKITNIQQKSTDGNAVTGAQVILTKGGTFVVGTGTTPPQIDDYKLESEIDSSKYTVSISVANGVAYTDKLGINVSCVITNKSEDILSISEIGLLGDNSLGMSYKYLLAREVFDTPITIAPGGTKSFVLKLF